MTVVARVVTNFCRRTTRALHLVPSALAHATTPLALVRARRALDATRVARVESGRVARRFDANPFGSARKSALFRDERTLARVDGGSRARRRARRARARDRDRADDVDARRRARRRATTADARRGKSIAVFPSDGDSRARTDGGAGARDDDGGVRERARRGAYEAVVVARGDDGAWADCALATTRDARAGRARAAARATSDDFDDGDGDEGAARV